MGDIIFKVFAFFFNTCNNFSAILLLEEIPDLLKKNLTTFLPISTFFVYILAVLCYLTFFEFAISF